MSTILGKLKATSWYVSYRNWRHRRTQAKELRDWERRGRPAPPPPDIKRKVIKEYAEKYGLKVLVETGTYRGDTVEAMRNLFARIYSIELGRELFEKARERFKPFKHIEIIHGDSGKELKRVVNELDEPALFYLDGHYSAADTARGEKNTPVLEELDHILKSPEDKHVIIIDDARCFGSEPGYPSLAELKQHVWARRGNVQISVADDSVRIVPA